MKEQDLYEKNKPNRSSSICRYEVRRISELIRKRRKTLNIKREWNKRPENKDILYTYEYIKTIKCTQDTLQKRNAEFYDVI